MGPRQNAVMRIDVLRCVLLRDRSGHLDDHPVAIFLTKGSVWFMNFSGLGEGYERGRNDLAIETEHVLLMGRAKLERSFRRLRGVRRVCTGMRSLLRVAAVHVAGRRGAPACFRCFVGSHVDRIAVLGPAGRGRLRGPWGIVRSLGMVRMVTVAGFGCGFGHLCVQRLRRPRLRAMLRVAVLRVTGRQGVLARMRSLLGSRVVRLAMLGAAGLCRLRFSWRAFGRLMVIRGALAGL